MDYKYLADLLSEVEIPHDGITSRTMHGDENTRAMPRREAIHHPLE